MSVNDLDSEMSSAGGSGSDSVGVGATSGDDNFDIEEHRELSQACRFVVQFVVDLNKRVSSLNSVESGYCCRHECSIIDMFIFYQICKDRIRYS